MAVSHRKKSNYCQRSRRNLLTFEQKATEGNRMDKSDLNFTENRSEIFSKIDCQGSEI